MSTPFFTVIVPTFDHGDLVQYSLRSILRQTLQDFEILVIGDGITAEGRECVNAFASEDSRVRLFEFPKDSRNGEIYRHQLLTGTARGQLICYVGDDDLLLPDHLQCMAECLREYDFAHPLAVFVNTENQLGVAEGHLGLDACRRRLLAAEPFNFISLTGAAHTMALYRKLPYGWRTTPSGLPTDLYMWKQILSFPGCRAFSSPRATTLHFPSAARRSWTREQQHAQILQWEKRIQQADGETFVATKALESLIWVQTCQGEEIRALQAALASDPKTVANG